MKVVSMDKSWWENFLVKALILIVSSSAVSGLLSKDNWKTALKNFLAGMFAGTVSLIICTSANVSQTWTLIICMVSTGFVTSIWPLVGQIAIKKIKQKADDDLPVS